MKLSLTLLALPLLALANPVAVPDAAAEPEALAGPEPVAEADVAIRADQDRRFQAATANTLQKRARTCALTGSNVRYRKCPSTDPVKCPGVGEYGAKGTKVSFTCYTTGSSVNGDK